VDKTLPVAESSGKSDPKDAAKGTEIAVGITAVTVQAGGQVTGFMADAIYGPVTIINAGSAVDLEAIRRVSTETLRQPILSLHPYEPETILIPGGPFLMGAVDLGAPAWARLHEVTLPDFRIGRYPVTNKEFAVFISETKATDWATSECATKEGWFVMAPPQKMLGHPVTCVTWHDAVAYCTWLSQQTGRRYILPSEAEWEKAASWGAGEDWVTRKQGKILGKRMYPWGGVWIEGRCNAASSGTMTVTSHPDGASDYGVEDLLGNVQEWTRSLWGRRPGKPDFGYPYDPADGRELTDPDKLRPLARLVHRGGSFKSAPADLRCTARANAVSDSKIAWRGFRVALRLE
jgi:formylglycine-generating enzyme required for sulfatase activity